MSDDDLQSAETELLPAVQPPKVWRVKPRPKLAKTLHWCLVFPAMLLAFPIYVTGEMLQEFFSQMQGKLRRLRDGVEQHDDEDADE